VKISWHEPKRISNFAKHGVEFAAIGEEFFASAIVVPAKQGRSQALGWLGSIVVSVIFEPRDDDAITIISARPASRKERKFVNG
jgi:uncharacterized DUF497 family protein